MIRFPCLPSSSMSSNSKLKAPVHVLMSTLYTRSRLFVARVRPHVSQPHRSDQLGLGAACVWTDSLNQRCAKQRKACSSASTPRCSLFRSFAFLFVRPTGLGLHVPGRQSDFDPCRSTTTCARTRLKAKRHPFVVLQRQSSSQVL